MLVFHWSRRCRAAIGWRLCTHSWLSCSLAATIVGLTKGLRQTLEFQLGRPIFSTNICYRDMSWGIDWLFIEISLGGVDIEIVLGDDIDYLGPNGWRPWLNNGWWTAGPCSETISFTGSVVELLLWSPASSIYLLDISPSGILTWQSSW